MTMNKIDQVIAQLRGDDSATELLRAWSRASAMLMITLKQDNPSVKEESVEPGKILFASARAEAVFGYVEGQLQGRDFRELIPVRFRQRHEDHFSNFSSQPRTRTMGTGDQLWALRKDGHEIRVEIGLHACTFAGVLVAIVVLVESRPDGNQSEKGGCPFSHGQ